ncbi:Ent-kaurene oxidase [Lachnellula suecica]|uniref:Ent-kaurene oxidase n=1 Tax=Lachnellula suecica TaxID=602035 RepID=A0A8T9C8B6_9HELO|nr:Ent-kaurene oxidase [Lachnellula suecica]
MCEGNLHTRILQTKLTPNLAAFTIPMKDEVDRTISTVGEAIGDDWKEVRIYEILVELINRIANRVFLGEIDSRNEEWSKAAIGYAENVTLTVMILRLFPLALRPFASWFVPSAWRLKSDLRHAKRALVPIINRRREAEKDAGYVKPNDFLQWMMDGAVGDECRPETLAHRQLILILASVHTTTMTGAHAFYDLCAKPEYFEPLREEIQQVVKEEGGWAKTTLTKFRKMDSFFKESQRMSPASLLGFHRIVQTPLTLSDGTLLPTGTHLCVASEAISKDLNFAPNALEFDGFRYFRKREEAEEANKHQFAMTDKDHVHFGHGKYACPGRFFASNELKMITALLIMEFDFKYPEGKTRPANLNADEFLYSDPTTTLLMKRRSSDKI